MEACRPLVGFVVAGGETGLGRQRRRARAVAAESLCLSAFLNAFLALAACAGHSLFRGVGWGRALVSASAFLEAAALQVALFESQLAETDTRSVPSVAGLH